MASAEEGAVGAGARQSRCTLARGLTVFAGRHEQRRVPMLAAAKRALALHEADEHLEPPLLGGERSQWSVPCNQPAFADRAQRCASTRVPLLFGAPAKLATPAANYYESRTMLLLFPDFAASHSFRGK